MKVRRLILATFALTALGASAPADGATRAGSPNCLVIGTLSLGDCPPVTTPPGSPNTPGPPATPAPPSQSTPSPPADPCGATSAIPTARNVAAVRSATLCLLNRERTSRHLRALKPNSSLERVATAYSYRMVAEQFFAHVSPSGSTLTSRVRTTAFLAGPLRSWSLGENLAWGTRERATPAKTMDAWMRSPGHRQNILTPGFRVIGIGIAPGAPDTRRSDAATYTTDFGVRSAR